MAMKNQDEYTHFVTADGDYTVVGCTSRKSAEKVLALWQEENPDAYIMEGNYYDYVNDVCTFIDEDEKPYASS